MKFNQHRIICANDEQPIYMDQINTPWFNQLSNHQIEGYAHQ